MELLFGPGMLFRNAVLGGLVVALVCSLLGVYVVLRRLVLLGVALPQAGAAGIAAAFWLTGHSHAPGGGGHTIALLGSLASTFGALALLVAGQRLARSPAEWGVGALFAIASAATVLFVAIDPTGDLEMTNLLRGELLSLADRDLVVLSAVSAVVLVLFVAFRREILLASFDREFARTIGREPGRADALLFGLFGVTIALGVLDAGPLVVFGFLVLPALAALRIAPSLGAALAISVAIGTFCSVSGFALAYRADLPTGPTSVALAAGCWLAASVAGRLWRRVRQSGASRAAATALVLVAALGLMSGCNSFFGLKPREEPLSRGTLPDLAARGPVVVSRFRNDTGNSLRIPSGNPLREMEVAIGAAEAREWRVTDALQQRAVHELARRGVAVLDFEAARAALPDVPTDAANAARTAHAAGIRTPVMFGDLRRFTVSGDDGIVVVRLDLTLVDPESGDVLWSGKAEGPVAVKSALTSQEVVLDAGSAIFAQAFGNDGSGSGAEKKR